MLLPGRIAELSGLSAQSHENTDHPYPPIGFCPVADHELGNGDTFGLYWPFGREAREPVVCEIWHDEGALVPMFSSLAALLDAACHSGEHPDMPGLSVDHASPVALFRAARTANGAGQAQDARLLLQQAVEIVPEYTDAQALLAAVHRRLGQNEEAMRAAVQAIISPPCFGRRPVQQERYGFNSRSLLNRQRDIFLHELGTNRIPRLSQ
jgi:hypothetical protein